MPPRYPSWTAAQEAQLKALYLANRPILTICAAVGRTRHACRAKLSQLGLTRQPVRWSAPRFRMSDNANGSTDVHEFFTDS